MYLLADSRLVLSLDGLSSASHYLSLRLDQVLSGLRVTSRLIFTVRSSTEPFPHTLDEKSIISAVPD